MDYIKKKKENFLIEKVNKLLINQFENSLDDYYSPYYKYEILQKDLFIDDYYYYQMLNYSKELIESRCNYLYLLIQKNKNNNQFGDSLYEKINNMGNEIVNIILKRINKDYVNDESDILFLKNKKKIFEIYFNCIYNNEFIEQYSLSKKNDKSIYI